MKKLLCASLLLMLSAVVAKAQDHRLFEVAGNLSMERHEGEGLPGWNWSFAVHRRPWSSFVFDVGRHTITIPRNARGETNKQVQLKSYLLGWRLSRPTDRRISPFAQVLLGVAHHPVIDGGTIEHGDGRVEVLPNRHDRTPFLAGGVGVGVNIRVNDRFAIRPFQFDSIISNDGGTENERWRRVSTGIVFRF